MILSSSYSGFDFWRDLVIQFGKEKAVPVANSYLDIPLDEEEDPDEFTFRCELYRAMMAAS